MIVLRFEFILKFVRAKFIVYQKFKWIFELSIKNFLINIFVVIFFYKIVLFEDLNGKFSTIRS